LCQYLIDCVCFFKKEEVPPTDEEMEQEEALKRSFRKVAGDDMEIDAFELRDILNAVFKKGLFNQNYYDIYYCFSFKFFYSIQFYVSRTSGRVNSLLTWKVFL